MCKERKFLEVVRTENRGKGTIEICRITEEGIAHVLAEVSPRQVLQDLVGAVASCGKTVAALMETAQQASARIDQLRAIAGMIVQSIEATHPPVSRNDIVPHGNGKSPGASETTDWKGAVVAYLEQWQVAHPTEDCTLSMLYRQARKTAPHLTMGQFHDGIRDLFDESRIYLHPWTGPLHDMPEPVHALLIGHEIAYYVSLR
jgi:hypothetical protein